jgi:hypothetical protein
MPCPRMETHRSRGHHPRRAGRMATSPLGECRAGVGALCARLHAASMDSIRAGRVAQSLTHEEEAAPPWGCHALGSASPPMRGRVRRRRPAAFTGAADSLSLATPLPGGSRAGFPASGGGVDGGASPLVVVVEEGRLVWSWGRAAAVAAWEARRVNIKGHQRLNAWRGFGAGSYCMQRTGTGDICGITLHYSHS